MSIHATYTTVDDRPTLSFERQLAYPVAAVWEAITEPGELVHWFPCEVEVDLRVGGAMNFIFPDMPLEDGPMTLTGEVTELEPPHRFSFLWGDDHLHFQLEETDGGAGCLMRFSVVLDSRDKAARDGAGWHQCLDALARQLAGAEVGRPHDSDAWRGHYQEYQRRGFPTGAALPADDT
jgi:uncharacterized protein YndB with AHSA1/START domain